MIYGQKIILQEVDSEDADTILCWENNPELWNVTENQGPFSLEEIRSFISDSRGLEATGQIRYMILNLEKSPIGAVDLFEYNEEKKSAGIGILIADPDIRRHGFASDALNTLIDFLRAQRTLYELKCIIYPENIASINLFLRCGFIETGSNSFKGRPVKCFVKQL